MITIQDIYDSYINGQVTQMTDQINEYGDYEFYEDLFNWLESNIQGLKVRFNIFAWITIIYNRINED